LRDRSTLILTKTHLIGFLHVSLRWTQVWLIEHRRNLNLFVIYAYFLPFIHIV